MTDIRKNEFKSLATSAYFLIMLVARRIIYLLLLIFCIWLAFATRLHSTWFTPFIVNYGGDTIWAGQFLFFLRMIFIRAPLLQLACFNFFLGVLVELSQLYHAAWIDSIRSTVIGEALLGIGFLWSDIVCYAVGTLLAYGVCLVIDKVST